MRREIKGKTFVNASLKPNKMFANYFFFKSMNEEWREMEFDCVQLYFMSFRVQYFFPFSFIPAQIHKSALRFKYIYSKKKNLVEHFKTFILFNGHLFIHNSGEMERIVRANERSGVTKGKKTNFQNVPHLLFKRRSTHFFCELWIILIRRMCIYQNFLFVSCQAAKFNVQMPTYDFLFGCAFVATERSGTLVSFRKQ